MSSVYVDVSFFDSWGYFLVGSNFFLVTATKQGHQMVYFHTKITQFFSTKERKMYVCIFHGHLVYFNDILVIV
jgi:hypothetical protein